MLSPSDGPRLEPRSLAVRPPWTSAQHRTPEETDDDRAGRRGHGVRAVPDTRLRRTSGDYPPTSRPLVNRGHADARRRRGPGTGTLARASLGTAAAGPLHASHIDLACPVGRGPVAGRPVAAQGRGRLRARASALPGLAGLA